MKTFVAAAALAALHSITCAAVVGSVDGPTGRIDFMDDAGPCVGSARHAVFVPKAVAAGPTAEPIAGCWVAQGGVVMVVFFDADIAQVPVAAVVPVKST